MAIDHTALVAPGLREVTADGKLRLRFHEGQMRAWKSKKRFVFMLAGTQGGKTSFCPHWLHREIAEVRDEGQGVGDFLAVASTFDQFKLKMLPEMREVFEHILRIGRYWAGERVIELAEGLESGGRFLAEHQDDRMYGRIILRSAEATAGLEAATARAACLDEVGQPEFTLGAWEAVLRRLALYQGRVLGTTTVYGLGWLKLEVYDRWKAGDANFDIIQFDSTANPLFPAEEFERARASMPPWKFNMLYRGLFDKPAGMVYDCFDEAACVIDRFPIPESWLWYVGHDFGSVNPAAVIFAQDPSTGLFYLVHEYLPGAKGVYEQVDDLKKMTLGARVMRRVGGSLQEKGWRDDYTAQGWPVGEAMVRDVALGIGRVYAFHKRNAIMVFRDCKRYLDEKLSYSYKLGDGYGATDVIDRQSSYHLMDAERYVLGGFHAESHGAGAPVQRRSARF